MTNNARALTLSIDAHSPDDMVMLLRQAMYELEKLLPLPRGASVGEQNSRSMADVLGPSNPATVVKGSSVGTIGTYSFEFHRNSREYTQLENKLLSEGFTRVQRTDTWHFGDLVYTHPTLPTACIEGEPLAICSAKPDAMDGPF